MRDHQLEIAVHGGGHGVRGHGVCDDGVMIDLRRMKQIEIDAAAALITAPPAPSVPEPARGKPALGLVICYAGDPAEGERVIAPLRQYGPPGRRPGAADALHRPATTHRPDHARRAAQLLAR